MATHLPIFEVGVSVLVCVSVEEGLGLGGGSGGLLRFMSLLWRCVCFRGEGLPPPLTPSYKKSPRNNKCTRKPMSFGANVHVWHVILICDMAYVICDMAYACLTSHMHL